MADFQLFKNKFLDIEGGYQNNPADRGNYNRDGELVAPILESPLSLMKDGTTKLPLNQPCAI